MEDFKIDKIDRIEYYSITIPGNAEAGEFDTHYYFNRSVYLGVEVTTSDGDPCKDPEILKLVNTYLASQVSNVF